MKKLTALFCLFLLSSFTAGDSEIALKVTKIQPLDADKCAVTMELHNKSHLKRHYVTMYCSDSGFYVTDNPNVKVIPKPCDKNFPKTVMLPRNGYRMANLELQMAKDAKDAKFRIGFKFMEVPMNYVIQNFDSTTVKSVTIWSNEIVYKR